MKTSEIDDVMALLERILPDPGGFAERLVDQMVTRLSGAAQYIGNLSTPSEPERIIVEPSYRPAPDDPLTDMNVLLASALGACDCWGLRFDCAVCNGAGSSGWTEPDAKLFQEFVGPAVEKLSAADAEPAANSPGDAGRADNNQGTTQGGSA